MTLYLMIFPLQMKLHHGLEKIVTWFGKNSQLIYRIILGFY